MGKLEIIQVSTPKFEYNGQDLYVEDRMFKNLKEFQDEIDEYERKGATKCCFFSLHTEHGPQFISPIYWIRRKYIFDSQHTEDVKPIDEGYVLPIVRLYK